MTKKIIDEDIEKDYIFAVDKTKRPTQKRIVKAISKGVGTSLVHKNLEDQIGEVETWKEHL